jgi:hypothetical protein
MITNALYDGAKKMAEKAKDGVLKYNGQTYIFEFQQKGWYYKITNKSNGDVKELNFKNLSECKKYFIWYLQN